MSECIGFHSEIQIYISDSLRGIDQVDNELWRKKGFRSVFSRSYSPLKLVQEFDFFLLTRK